MEEQFRQKVINVMQDALETIERGEAQRVVDGCNGCAFWDVEEWELPCNRCKRNCKDYWRPKEETIKIIRKKPTRC